MTRAQITGVVLCGGRAMRMDGVEKPLQQLHGRPMVDHVLERLRPQVHRVLVSANRDREVYAALGAPVVADLTPDIGPLGGLHACLQEVQTPWFFCCPGDAPFLNRHLVERLLRHTSGTGPNLLYPHDGTRDQHLFLLGRTSLGAALDAFLTQGGRSVGAFVAAQQAIAVPLHDLASSFVNINTRAALEAAEAIAP